MPDTSSLDGLSTPRHFFSIRTLLSTVAVFAVAIALAITAAGGSYASWNSNGAVNGGTISAGTIGLTVNGATSATVNLTGTTLLPGRSVVQATPLQFANTGSTPINVTSAVVFAPASAALQPHLKISLRPAVGATCTVAPDPSTLPATIAPLAFTVGQTIPMCLEVVLLTSAPASAQDATVAFTINLAATQVQP